jgi:hypothetical protein
VKTTFKLPNRERCCWRFQFRAVTWDESTVLAKSNLLRASSQFIDF